MKKMIFFIVCLNISAVNVYLASAKQENICNAEVVPFGTGINGDKLDNDFLYVVHVCIERYVLIGIFVAEQIIVFAIASVIEVGNVFHII